MPSSYSITKVQTIYVAYYGRPGDPGGVDYWATRLDNRGNLDAIIDAFGDSEEYVNNYGGLESEELVETLFLQILGRGADPEGLQFYTGLLGSGVTVYLRLNRGLNRGAEASRL